MIMLGCHFMMDVPMEDGTARTLKDAVPFREVYIHALVRDADRQKMSKTKGNVIDPIDIIGRFGTDAVRFTLAAMASPGTDIAFSEQRTEGYRAFANKIWNAARFLFMQIESAKAAGVSPRAIDLAALKDAPIEARWIVSRLQRTAVDVNAALGEYRFHEAANFVYQFFWGEFCDWYLEAVKLRLRFEDGERTSISLDVLVGVFEGALRLLSPFMPFITEELWHALHDGEPAAKSIALTRFPQAEDYAANAGAEREFGLLQELIGAVREIRKQAGVPEKEAVPVVIHSTATDAIRTVSGNQDLLAKLARIADVRVASASLEGANTRHLAALDVAIEYERKVDVAVERERLSKELERLSKEWDNSQRQLQNENFLAKAPAKVVEGLRTRAAELPGLLEKTRSALSAVEG